MQVRQLSELSQVNERCLDLQRNKSASSSSKRKSTPGDGLSSAAVNSSVVGFSGAPKPRAQRRRQRGSSKTAGCPFLSVEGGAAAWDELKDLVLGAPVDVEELASLGRKMKVRTTWHWDGSSVSVRACTSRCYGEQLSLHTVVPMQTANSTCRCFVGCSGVSLMLEQCLCAVLL